MFFVCWCTCVCVCARLGRAWWLINLFRVRVCACDSLGGGVLEFTNQNTVRQSCGMSLWICSFVGLFSFISVTLVRFFRYTHLQVCFHLYRSLFYVSFGLLFRRSFFVYTGHFCVPLWTFIGLFGGCLLIYMCLFCTSLLMYWSVGLFSVIPVSFVGIFRY